ncbi:cell envelope integrity protein TolA [Psychromonas sp. CD1]|uniref:cell envelope integrity protein TolA n=1 Tax=Psychromonas sp. CD1 TaxID=1979839 RepID=UPI000B9B11FE|nr:cell envelope integrity protein TolA [Psychromonas sp. CD1]
MKKNDCNNIAFVSALALHLIVVGVLIIGANYTLPKEKPKPQKIIINATMVNPELLLDLANRKSELIRKERQRKQQIVAEKLRKKRKKEQLLAQKTAQEKRKIEEAKIEKKRIYDAQVVQQKAVKEAKRVAEVKRVADIKEQKRVAEVKRLVKVKEKQRLASIAKVAAAEKERLRQAELDKAMEAEFSDAFSQAKNAKELSEIEKYKNLIEDKISRNWQIEPSMKGKLCRLNISLAPDGLVIKVDVVSGDRRVCQSARRATLKAKMLPIPQNTQIASQFRQFSITLAPKL